MALTRILNNQVTDASGANAYLGINAAAKLQNYSITSGKLANNLTYASNLTVTGNLDIQGTTTTLDTYNVVIEDPLLLLAKDQSGSPAVDIGFIGERGTDDNIAFIWVEADDRFATIFSNTVSSNTTANINGYANLYTGNLEVQGLATFPTISAGNIFASGNITGANVIANASIIGQDLDILGNGVIHGNLTVQGNLQYINVDDLRVEDPVIIIGTGPNGNALTSNDGYDRGVYMEYYTAGLGNAFVGWANTSGHVRIAANVDFASNNVINVVEYGTFEAGNATLQSLNLSLTGGNGNAIIGNIANVTGTSLLSGMVTIGAESASFANAALAIGATTSMLIPTGNIGQRPTVGNVGMIRFNTTADTLEYYDSSGWTSAGTTFTIVTADSFVGNGSANTFTLSANSTTAATVVSINGIVQIPTTAYSVSGNVLTFTEAPEASDVIDARLFVTTTTVTALTGGGAIFEADGNGNFVLTGNIIPSSNGTANLGSSSSQFQYVFAQATSAQYADLAENYEADAAYEPGTVVSFGGEKEVTASTASNDKRVAGVVSTNPSYLMNSAQSGEFVVAVALTGRVPCRVKGTVRKGDLMVSNGDGSAVANNDAATGSVIGKALEDFDGAEGTIEVVVGRV